VRQVRQAREVRVRGGMRYASPEQAGCRRRLVGFARRVGGTRRPFTIA
jgi:hypothetical protein